MKKYLLLAAAGLTAAACADKGLENNHQNGELEESYVAISLAAGDMNTKAGTDPVGEYIDGTTTERQVKSAYVFFFYENGDAFVVDQAANVNYVPVLEGFDVNPPENNNVSDAACASLKPIKSKVQTDYALKNRYMIYDDAVIGRSRNCDIVIPEDFISSNHVHIWYEDGEWYLEDLGSRNGTTVNEQRILHPVILDPEDIISLGGLNFVFEL